MQLAVLNRATIEVADTAEVSGRVTADDVNLDRFQNRIGKVCALVAARSKVYLSAATMILIMTLAVPATAQKQVSFSGAIQGREFDTRQGNTLTVNGSATGIATLLGQFSLTYQATVNLTTRAGTGSGQLLIAASGDMIFATNVGQIEFTSTPGVGSITETY
jgi:hypothetical protein